MTLGRGVAAAPAMARQQREEFAGLKDKSGLGSVRASSELQKLNQAQAVAETRPAEDRLPGLQRQMRTVRGRPTTGATGLGRRPHPGSAAAAGHAHRFRFRDYFDSAEKAAGAGAVLALGRNVRFVAAGRIIEIFDPEETGE